MSLKKNFEAEVKRQIDSGKTGRNAVIGAVVTMGLMTTQQAMAALPTGLTDGITAMQTDAGLLIDAFWPFIIFVTSAFLIIKFFKKGTAKVG
jgi:hypothetical protein